MGIACPDSFPLLGFVSLFAPAVVRGNTMVIVPSEKYPLSATDLYQVEAVEGILPRVDVFSCSRSSTRRIFPAVLSTS